MFDGIKIRALGRPFQFFISHIIKPILYIDVALCTGASYAALAQMVACLPLVQQVRCSIPGGVVNFHLKILNLVTRRSGDVHFLIARLYITGLY